MKRVPRLLLVAFALSLLVHVVVALILHPPSLTQESRAEVVSIEHRPATIALKRPPTPPPPPPRRKQSPAPRASSSLPPSPKGLTAEGPGGRGPAPTPAVAVATPPPATPAPGGACTQPNAPASVVATPGPPDIAPDARASATSGVALIAVALDAAGQVTGASVARSTGNGSLDVVALQMARDARYSPALHDCKAVASSYDFSVKFVAW